MWAALGLKRLFWEPRVSSGSTWDNSACLVLQLKFYDTNAESVRAYTCLYTLWAFAHIHMYMYKRYLLQKANYKKQWSMKQHLLIFCLQIPTSTYINHTILDLCTGMGMVALTSGLSVQFFQMKSLKYSSHLGLHKWHYQEVMGKGTALVRAIASSQNHLQAL